ncbi:MAG: CpsD/CapB family tyrosine-protein kinase, partial [Pyrinomonadaceae bacterium]
RAADFDSVEISVARVEPHLIAITQPQSAEAELYRSLRTRVIRAQEVRRMQTFLVTSAGPAEGKTITSLNLAWLLAQTDGVKALLIEGDLRRPCMAEYLGVNGALGLADVLAGEVSLGDAILRLEPSGLHLLPGGTSRENVAEILSGHKADALLAEAREMFNYIIIDAPPLGVFADASVLMNRVDGALLVVRAGQTRYAHLDQLLAPLQRERILGVVLNGAEEGMDDSHYYHNYYKQRVEETAAAAVSRVSSGEEIHAS